MIAVSDPDFTLHVGDVRDVLATLEDGSVDCCVTSPPYWGLRDYGTGSWEGGDPDCDHNPARAPMSERPDAHGFGTRSVLAAQDQGATVYRDVCGKCGARRVDQQLGLEPTPDAYVASMVAVFREVRRVLADHGTVWCNLGDTYNSRLDGSHGGWNGSTPEPQRTKNEGAKVSISAPGMKPKDLVGIPWRVAFALQADGWYLRSDIIWSKPNPMPESVTDRPTKAHEYVFLLSKRSRYWFDQEAVRERAVHGERFHGAYAAPTPTGPQRVSERNGRSDAENTTTARNVRSVWEIATQPYPEAHFATFPEELARRCILAGCPEWVCRVCGKPRERLTLIEYDNPGNRRTNGPQSERARDDHYLGTIASRGVRLEKRVTTEGWSDCGHGDYRAGVVLDPFLGSGTTALVARQQGRHTVGIELNPEYAELAARRLQQLSLFADGAAS